MSRKQQAAELRATWMVHEPRVAGVPFSRKDLEDAAARNEAERAAARNAIVVPAPPPEPAGISRRTYLPALTRAAQEAAQVPMRK